MKRILSPRAGFTLVELLTVIAIITILAGLTIGGMTFAWKQAGLKRAEGEIQAFTTALESYKADNGDYPDDINSKNISPQVDVNPTAGSGGFNPKYQSSSLTLFAALSGTSVAPGATSVQRSPNPGTKTYFIFKSNQLWPKNPIDPNAPVTALVDPFGNPYGYSTAQHDAILDANSGSGNGSAAPATNVGYNPTFDLWSTAGETGAGVQVRWVKNW